MQSWHSGCLLRTRNRPPARSRQRRGRPIVLDFQRQNSRNPLRCQRMSVFALTFTSASRPREHATQGCHHPTGGIIGSSWFDLALLEECQLLTKEEVFCSQRSL